MKNLQFRCGKEKRARLERSKTQITSSFYFTLRSGKEIYVCAQVKLHLLLIKYFNSLVFSRSHIRDESSANTQMEFFFTINLLDLILCVFFISFVLRSIHSIQVGKFIFSSLALIEIQFYFVLLQVFHIFFGSMRFHQLTSHAIAFLSCP